MSKKIHYKAIRDRIPIKEEPGVSVITLPPDVFSLFLIQKLHEEAEEISSAPQDPFEYADMIEVLLTLAYMNSVPWEDIQRCYETKHESKGGFSLGRVLIEVQN